MVYILSSPSSPTEISSGKSEMTDRYLEEYLILRCIFSSEAYEKYKNTVFFYFTNFSKVPQLLVDHHGVNLSTRDLLNIAYKIGRRRPMGTDERTFFRKDRILFFWNTRGMYLRQIFPEPCLCL